MYFYFIYPLIYILISTFRYTFIYTFVYFYRIKRMDAASTEFYWAAHPFIQTFYVLRYTLYIFMYLYIQIYTYTHVSKFLEILSSIVSYILL